MEKQIKQQNHTLNILKVICTILVVFIHCSFPDKLGSFIIDISRISVPTYFLISGYYVYNNDKNKILKKLKKILKILIYSCIFWFIFNVIRYSIFDIISLKYYIMNLFNTKSLFHFLIFNENIFWTHLWFLHALCYCYLLQYYLKKTNYENTKLELGISIFLLVLYLLFNKYLIKDDLSNMYIIRNFLFVGVPFFLIGKNLNKKSITNIISLNFILFLIFASFIFMIFERKIITSELYISTIILTISLFTFCMKKPNFFNKKFEFISKNLCLSIYIIHPAIKYIVLGTLSYLKIDNIYIDYSYPIITLVLTFIIAYILYTAKYHISYKIKLKE